jgi:hypothetical protein
LKKRTKKLFPTLGPGGYQRPGQKGKSLFASFSSEKEDS